MPQEALRKSVNFEVTIADMARRSERRAWRVAAAATAMSLILGAGYFYFLPLKEKVPYLIMADAYSLFAQAYDRLKQIRDLGFLDENCFVNAAGSLVAEAKTHGLKRIDHIVQSTHGNNLIGIQGRMDDPANRWVHVDKGSAVAQHIQFSTNQADGVRQRQQGDRQSGYDIQAAISR